MLRDGTEVDGAEPPGSVQSAALPSALQVPGVTFRVYLKAWNARLVPNQSQKIVRTTLRVGGVVSGRLTLTR